MPLKVLVLAELSGRDLSSGRSTPRAERIRIDGDSFEHVLAGFDLRVTLPLRDGRPGQPEPPPVELRLTDLKSFRPEAIAQQVPATRDLLGVREALAEVRTGRRSLVEVRDQVASIPESSPVLAQIRSLLEGVGRLPAAPAPPARPAPGDAEASGALDSLIDMVETPGGGAGAGARSFDPGRFDALIRSLVASERSGRSPDPRAAGAAVRALDAAVGAHLDEVIHHPEFRRLEAAWRGLKFLVDRTDFRRPIRMEILSTGRETLIEIYDDLVHRMEADRVSSEPLSLVLVDQAFGNRPEDLDLLRALAERGSSLSVPVLASAGAEMLGLDGVEDLDGRTGLREVLGGEMHAKWRGLRSYSHSRWLGLAFNRFLLRPHYGPDGLTTRGFDYVESLLSDDLRAWGNPGWAVAALATRSFARIGWCTDIMGQRPSGMVDGLPVRPRPRRGADTVSFPLEAIISDAVERDLNENGLMTLSAALNGDRAYLRLAPSVHAPGHYPDPTDRARARLQSTLPFQMFVGRVINYAMLLEPSLVPGRDVLRIQADYDRALRELLSSAGPVPPDAVQVRVLPNEEDASRQDLCLKVRWPGAQSLPGAGEVELRWPLAG